MTCCSNNYWTHYLFRIIFKWWYRTQWWTLAMMTPYLLYGFVWWSIATCSMRPRISSCTPLSKIWRRRRKNWKAPWLTSKHSLLIYVKNFWQRREEKSLPINCLDLTSGHVWRKWEWSIMRSKFIVCVRKLQRKRWRLKISQSKSYYDSGSSAVTNKLLFIPLSLFIAHSQAAGKPAGCHGGSVNGVGGDAQTLWGEQRAAGAGKER